MDDERGRGGEGGQGEGGKAGRLVERSPKPSFEELKTWGRDDVLGQIIPVSDGPRIEGKLPVVG